MGEHDANLPKHASFTPRGWRYYRSQVPLFDGTHLSNYLRDQASVSHIQTELLLEAQRCLNSGCFRAGIDVVGLALEGAVLELLGTLGGLTEASNSSCGAAWKRLRDPDRRVASRWSAGREILLAVRLEFKKAKPPEWRELWEFLPNTLNDSIGAIREARNSASHDAAAVIGHAELALWLTSAPKTITGLWRLGDYLENPPVGVTIPAV